VKRPWKIIRIQHCSRCVGRFRRWFQDRWETREGRPTGQLKRNPH